MDLELTYPTPRTIRQLLTEDLVASGDAGGVEMPGGEHADCPLQIRVRIEKGPVFFVRTVIMDGGSSYLSQYTGEFKNAEAVIVFMNGIVRDAKGE